MELSQIRGSLIWAERPIGVAPLPNQVTLEILDTGAGRPKGPDWLPTASSRPLLHPANKSASSSRHSVGGRRSAHRSQDGGPTPTVRPPGR